jgi:hypothetical protein
MSEVDLSVRSTVAITMAGPRKPSRFRMGLAGLMSCVLAVAIGAWVFREARPWEWLRDTLELDRILDLPTAFLAIGFSAALLRPVVVRWRRLRAGYDRLPFVAVGWRIAVVIALGTYLLAEVPLLHTDDLIRQSFRDYPREARRRLLTLGATLVMIGVLAGLRWAPVQSRRHRTAWLSVLWAGVAGVLIMATLSYGSYLVLLALEAVSNARTRLGWTERTGPGLFARIERSGLLAVPAVVCCLLLALLISRELRSPVRRVAPTWPGALALWLASAATALTAAWLLWIAIPMLHTNVSEGLWLTVAPADVAVIVFGFAGLALGLAAQGADRPSSVEPDEELERPHGRLLGRLVKVAAVLMLLDVIAGRVLAIGGYAEWSWMHWTGWLDAALDRLWRQPWMMAIMPEWLALTVAQAWLFWRVACLWLTPVGTEPTPIDVCLENRAATGRFAVCWVALTVLMVAALPVLFVVGLAVLDGFVRAFG